VSVLTLPERLRPSPEQMVRWISRYRFRPYLAAANYDHEAALQLYEWNAEASAAFLEVFHYVEVLLRNVMDDVMSGLEVAPTARLRPHDGWWFLSGPSSASAGTAWPWRAGSSCPKVNGTSATRFWPT
jgi:hypothetical protein